MQQVVERPSVGRVSDQHDSPAVVLHHEIVEELTRASDDVSVALAVLERLVDMRPPGAFEFLDLHAVHGSVVALAKPPILVYRRPAAAERDLAGLHCATEVRREDDVDRAGSTVAELTRLLSPQRREGAFEPTGRNPRSLSTDVECVSNVISILNASGSIPELGDHDYLSMLPVSNVLEVPG